MGFGVKAFLAEGVEPCKGKYAHGVRILGCLVIHFQPFASVLREIGRNVTQKLLEAEAHLFGQRCVRRKRPCQLAVFSGKLPSMEAEFDCKRSSDSS